MNKINSRQQVLDAIRANPWATQKQLQRVLRNVPPGSVSGYCSHLYGAGLLARKDVNGSWGYHVTASAPPAVPESYFPKKAAVTQSDRAPAPSGKTGDAGSTPAGSTRAAWSRVADLKEARELAKVMAE